MKDEDKTKGQLLKELKAMREWVVKQEMLEFERKKAEEALRKSEKRFEDIAFSSADWIWEVDRDGKYTYASEGVKQILGYEPEELKNKSPFDLMPEDESKRMRDIFNNRVKKRERLVDIENWRLTKDGKLVLILTNGVPILDERGKVTGYRGVNKDITKQKQAEEALRESELRYRELVELHPDGIAVHSQGKIVFVNQSGVKLIRAKSKDDLIGKSIFDFVHPDYKSVVLARIKQTQERGEYARTIEEKFLRLDGETIDVEVTAIPFLHDGKAATQVFIRDITEQKRNQEKIIETRTRAQQYLDLAGVIFIAIDRDQTVSLINKKGCELLGYAEDEIVGKNWFDNFIPDRVRAEVKSVFVQLMNGDLEPVEYFENPIVSRSGVEHVVEWHNTILKDSRNNIIGTLSSGLEIKGRKF